MSLRGHHESSYAHWEAACLGKRYKGVRGVLAIVTLLKFFAHLAVDIRLIPLIAMPVLGYVSTELPRASLYLSLPIKRICKHGHLMLLFIIT